MKKLIPSFLALLIFNNCQNLQNLKSINNYQPLASIVYKNGSAIDEEQIKKLEGKTIKVWGYIDRGNILLDEKIARVFIQRDFNDPLGYGVGIKLYGNRENYKKLFDKIKDTDEDRPIKILVKGKLYTFNKITNFSSSKGVGLEVFNVKDIKILANKNKGNF